MHDFRLLKKSDVIFSIPDWIGVWLDKGFIGIKKLVTSNNFFVPSRKSKKNPLTEEQKSENQIINSFRTVVEHTFAGVKRLGSVNQIYRNWGNEKADTFMLLACGLWNLHIYANNLT